MLHGAYALGIVSARAPGKLLGVKNGGAPLVVAVGSDGLFLASDIAAVLKYTRDVLVLDDGEMAVLSRDGVEASGPTATPSTRRRRRCPGTPRPPRRTAIPT